MKGVLEEISLKDVPPATNMLTTMWVDAVKANEQGEVIRLKAQLVARGDKQREGVGFI
uniref:Uncharacterized protein n=1 Tax=Peronospora matthiolae TaxID=2874970 RepID=A0AAV1UXT6_9STRA